MIRRDTWFGFHHRFERERRERAQQALIEHVKQRWAPFPLLIQVELQSHLTRFGLDAAEHATFLVERMLLERQAHHRTSLLSPPPSSLPIFEHE